MKKKKSDTTLKIFALVLSIVLWSYVMSEENPEQKREYKNINVEFTNTEALEKNELVIMNPNDASVNVTIEGQKSDFAKFSFEEISENIKAKVDLSGYNEGKSKVLINVSLNQLGNLKIKDFEPREILFTFDKIITKDKAVTIKTSGELAAGYVLGDIETSASTVALNGPRTWVNEVAEVLADVNLDGRKEDINVSVPIKMIDDKGNNVRGVTNDPGVVDVTIPVYKTNKIPIEIQTTNELPDNYESTDIEVNPTSVTLIGKESVSNLKFIQTKPIDINKFIENKTIEVELELPEGVRLANSKEKITVTLNVEEMVEKKFEYGLGEVEIKDLNEELELEEAQEDGEIVNIEISVKGSKENMEALTKEDIELYLDLSPAIKGENEIYISFNVPTGITVDQIKPQPILLKIRDKE